jgi:hypothetical protein
MPLDLHIPDGDPIPINLQQPAPVCRSYRSLYPAAKDSNVLYYGPGIHPVPGGILRVPSGKTLYLAGGAILKGQILVSDAQNVRVLGRGMVDQEVKMGIRVAHSKNVEINGLFATQCFTGGSENVTIRKVKVISYFGWGDGMNVISSNHVLMDSVFNRNSDDCTTVYGTRLGFKGGSKDITMQHATLWADVAHPILIGTHGNTPHPEKCWKIFTTSISTSWIIKKCSWIDLL